MLRGSQAVGELPGWVLGTEQVEVLIPVGGFQAAGGYDGYCAGIDAKTHLNPQIACTIRCVTSPPGQGTGCTSLPLRLAPPG